MSSRWQNKLFGLSIGSCAAFILLTAAANALLQATGQKVIVYSAILMVLVQSMQMRRKPPMTSFPNPNQTPIPKSQ